MKFLKVIQYIIGIGTIAGGAIWFSTTMDTLSDGQEDILEKVEYINVEQTFMADDIAGLHDTLEDMSDGIQRNAQTAERLIWMERNRDVFTPEQMETLLDEFLKKNSCLFLPDSIRWNDYVDYALITEPVNMKVLRNQ